METKKKKRSGFILALLLLVLGASLMACETPSGETPSGQTPATKFTITFNTNGGNAVPGQTVTDGGKLTKPTDPIKAEFTFGGWFKQSELTAEWNFASDTVTANITLYAKWTKSETPVTTYTVTFMNGDTVFDTQTIETGSDAVTPKAIPSKESTQQFDYSFSKWDKQFANITENLIVNAVFTSIDKLLDYTLSPDGQSYEITGIKDKSATVIVVPESYNGTPVVVIRQVFEGCSSLTSITLPFIGASKDGTANTHFGYIFGAISSSANGYFVPSSLKTVVVTDITSIGESAFYYCRSLTSITIPNSVTIIGEYAFYYCSSLTSITIPNSVKSIGIFAFYNCSKLANITLGNSVKSIGESAFSGCSSLTSITIPNSVTSIGYEAFYECINLTSITIPNSVKSIGEYAFGYCDSLTSITIPNSVTSIESGAFYGCSSLTIYAEAASKPSGWYSDEYDNNSWNPSNRPVVWGYSII